MSRSSVGSTKALGTGSRQTRSATSRWQPYRRRGHPPQAGRLGVRSVAIDDATRPAYVEVLSDEKAITAIGFLRRAVNHYASYGVTVERLITDG